MEDTLRVIAQEDGSYVEGVLILVLMEDTLRENGKERSNRKVES